MPTIRRSRRIAANPEEIWTILRDPHHLPRWWPRVSRVEGVSRDNWTTVLVSARGRNVRADYRLVSERSKEVRRWEQVLVNTPFERLLESSATEVRLTPQDGDTTQVELVLDQKVRGWSRFAPFMFRRAARRQLDEALEGLERICGR